MAAHKIQSITRNMRKDENDIGLL